ncbi:MAG: hypothetical protein H7296_02745 [Bacteroidia bacterium]|nr:hypothetical protein [Bacteroidia bacterium]
MNGSILIPENFTLNGKTYKVVIRDKELSKKGFWGQAFLNRKVIKLCDKFHGVSLTKEAKEQTFFHELIHMILDSMGYDKLNEDEDFVDLFAQRLHEYEKSKQ